jgi:mercuric ion transport protein
MHCNGCAERLQARLKTLPGVRAVSVSSAEHQARILYDPQANEEARLVEEIEKSGFRVAEQPRDNHPPRTQPNQSRAAGRPVSNRGWKSALLSLPAILASLIPSMTCPLCVTAYTALLSTLGLGFLMSSAYLLPLTMVMLAVAVAALGFEASKRGNWGPFALSLCGSTVILIGKFVLASEPATYTGVALLLGASIWNLWPRLLSLRSTRNAEMSL